MEDNKILIHFNTNLTRIFTLKNGKINLLEEKKIFFNETIVHDEMFHKIDNFLKNIKSDINNQNTRIIANGIFQELSDNEKIQLVIHVYVKFNLYFYIIPKDLEDFYMKYENDLAVAFAQKEYRKVVICGSFQSHIKEISSIIKVMDSKGIEVLSPWTQNVIPESLGTNFILLEGQELKNERDAWRHKLDHMNKFIKADAIIICNPEGRIGQGTMFEFGFMIAYSKRIIMTEKPANLSITFPYEIGLDYLIK